MNSVKLHLQTEAGVQQAVSSTCYNFASGKLNRSSYPPSIQLRRDETERSQSPAISPCAVTNIYSICKKLKTAPHQNSPALLQFHHVVIGQEDFHRADIGRLWLTALLIFSHYLEGGYL